ncbi:MAG TPA: ATP-dependent DNA helicase RecG, partial [Candidatus Acidoferrum sp.]|nr:ATP-dependent DNA helicase RecG [Candidatus Acidoferrum sp.]
TLTLETPVRSLFGVGSERAVQLDRLNIRTAGDVLLHRPHRYEDRRHFLKIADLKLKEPATVRGKIVAQGLKTFRQRSRSVFEFVLDDGSARLHCRWWNLPFMEKYFEVGDDVMVFGKPNSVRPRTIDHPETEVLDPSEDVSIHLDRIVPIYPLTEGLPQRWLRSLVWRTLRELEPEIVDPFPQVLALTQNRIPTRSNAVHMLHFPEELHDAELARQRLALDEFLCVQVEIQRRRRNLEANARAPVCPGTNALMKPFLARLGFDLTGAQTRVLREVRKGMSSTVPMRRLLQGDVGAGKTAVAACAALMAIESGRNAALMAPTEILAEQHFANFRRWFEPLGVSVALQTGARKVEGRESNDERQSGPMPSTLDSRRSTLFIGTHALITPAFDMQNLGLVIIDEQHKFGVAQREQLVRKGSFPHLLVMTATPIPRTLGLTLYGDLDISVLDELPPGRGRVRTFVRTREQLSKVHEFIRGKLSEGRQAYVVYARVSEADTEAGIKAAVDELQALQKEFSPHRAGLLHGRLNGAEKERIMSGFRANKLQVLLATSVIEVGVDVPNATVMVVENAEQFGLAQLHQLRGRIGRGAHESFCILVADMKTPEAQARLRVLEKSNDGFAIAEADLKLRGPGEFLGAAQSGLPPFRFGDIVSDARLLETSREIARQIVSA